MSQTRRMIHVKWFTVMNYKPLAITLPRNKIHELTLKKKKRWGTAEQVIIRTTINISMTENEFFHFFSF